MSTVVPVDSATEASGRPIVSDVADTTLGRSFTISFKPGQTLPKHSNPSRVAITAVQGSGSVSVDGEAERQLVKGDFVQLDPGVFHSLTAGDEGLEVEVALVENCCRMC